MYYNLHAFILKRYPYYDDDLTLRVYSLERGKLNLQARGAKKILSKLAGHLEPVSLSYLNVTRGRFTDQLIGAQAIHHYQSLKNNLVALGYANYFIEFIDRLTHDNQPDAAVFNLLTKSLNYLEKDSPHYRLARLAFGFKLLHLLGFNPAAKESAFLRQPINYFIRHRLDAIAANSALTKYLSALNNLLDREVRFHLDSDLNSADFLRQLLVSRPAYV